MENDIQNVISDDEFIIKIKEYYDWILEKQKIIPSPVWDELSIFIKDITKETRTKLTPILFYFSYKIASEKNVSKLQLYQELEMKLTKIQQVVESHYNKITGINYDLKSNILDGISLKKKDEYDCDLEFVNMKNKYDSFSSNYEKSLIERFHFDYTTGFDIIKEYLMMMYIEINHFKNPTNHTNTIY